MQPKAGGKLHLRLNTVARPIANNALAPGESRDRLDGGQKAARKVTLLRASAIGARSYDPPSGRGEIAASGAFGCPGARAERGVGRPGTVLSARLSELCCGVGSSREALGVRGLCQPPSRPVLKHGPKESNMCASRGGCTKPARRSEGECRRGPAEVRPGGPGCRRITGRFYPLVGGVERERACRDPKDGELCLKRLKPEETLVEDRSDSDVQIDRQIWV
ncbi:unnamed protein product [Clavelina lepadiformis]|uniref:Uncharacterized protein n=1 Tax=Clavelina lepadiformis TaxID=159417 RepID=A0ABP0GUR4_CLALP